LPSAFMLLSGLIFAPGFATTGSRCSVRPRTSLQWCHASWLAPYASAMLGPLYVDGLAGVVPQVRFETALLIFGQRPDLFKPVRAVAIIQSRVLEAEVFRAMQQVKVLWIIPSSDNYLTHHSARTFKDAGASLCQFARVAVIMPVIAYTHREITGLP